MHTGFVGLGGKHCFGDHKTHVLLQREVEGAGFVENPIGLRLGEQIRPGRIATVVRDRRLAMGEVDCVADWLQTRLRPEAEEIERQQSKSGPRGGGIDTSRRGPAGTGTPLALAIQQIIQCTPPRPLDNV